MKTIFESFVVAFSMYSRIPMPQTEWNKKNMRYSMAFFPAVGAVIAAVLYGVFLLFRNFSQSPAFFAAAAVLVPVLLTGGIHVDGFCDTCDALASHESREKKLEIMKDPHVGAFGVIYTAVILIAQFGAFCQFYLKPRFVLPLLLSFVLSRALSGIAVVNFKKAKNSGLAATFSGFASEKAVSAVLIVIAAASVAFSGVFDVVGFIVPAVTLLAFLLFYGMTKRQFGGITGDLSGFFTTVSETAAIAVCAFLGAAL